uniref:ELMO/CED-12 domain containing 2 n=1 Tax=Sinocyclocheilus anshuiensis TaxID=1608454 RepID=A0A671LA39_9TELE
MLGYIWQCFYSSCLRFWLKWFLRLVTGRCELQRICARCKAGALRTAQIGEDHTVFVFDQVLRAALSLKEIGLDEHLHVFKICACCGYYKGLTAVLNLRQCLLQINAYNELFEAVEEVRKQVFDSENKEHENMQHLWDLLMPSVKLESRITKQWGNIGFQGDDPKTDFRGMGMLGLTNLLFFSENLGINLTEMAYMLIFAPVFLLIIIRYLAYEFDKFWLEEEPESIMEFNRYREKFHDKVKGQLQMPEVTLIMTVDQEK